MPCSIRDRPCRPRGMRKGPFRYFENFSLWYRLTPTTPSGSMDGSQSWPVPKSHRGKSIGKSKREDREIVTQTVLPSQLQPMTDLYTSAQFIPHFHYP